MDGIKKFAAVVIATCMVLYAIMILSTGNASDMVKAELNQYEYKIKKLTDVSLLREELMHYVCFNDRILLLDGGGNNRIVMNPDYWFGTVNRCENWEYIKPKLHNRIRKE